MKIKLKIITSLFLITVSTSLKGAEVDPFSNYERQENLRDSSLLINQKANKLVDKVLKKLNRSRIKKGCYKPKLYKKLRRVFHNRALGKLGWYIAKSKRIDRDRPNIKNSVFKEWSFKESKALYLLPRIAPKGNILAPLSYTIKYNGFFLGDDKFEHLFSSGFRYFKSFYQEGRSLGDTLKIGIKEEEGTLGIKANGIFSYGDLVANFNGMRFWNDILAENPDILGVDSVPVISCKNNKWVRNRSINFKKYIDEGVDEARNCMLVKKKSMLNKVVIQISNLIDKNKSFPFCDAHELLSLKYGDLSPFLLNHKGLGVFNRTR